MEIKYDKSYLNLYADQRNAGYTREIISKIIFDAKISDNKSMESFKTIKDWLEENYNMYQYKKDNGVKYGEHELFYWVSCTNPESYWTIDYNEGLSFERRNEITEQILKYITGNFNDAEMFIRLQYSNCMDWKIVNDYLNELEVDYNNFPYDKIRPIFYFQFTGDWKYLTKKNAEKLYSIQEALLKSFEGKRVLFNDIKGTFHITDSGICGVWPPRNKRTYYKITMSNIHTLVVL